MYIFSFGCSMCAMRYHNLVVNIIYEGIAYKMYFCANNVVDSNIV